MGSRRLRIAVYAVVAVGSLVLTWSNNLAWMRANPGAVALDFIADVFANPAAASIGWDILGVAVACVAFMLVEARRLGIRFVWAYVLGGALIAISVTFPLFLIAREQRLAAGEEVA